MLRRIIKRAAIAMLILWSAIGLTELAYITTHSEWFTFFVFLSLVILVAIGLGTYWTED